MKSSGSVQVRYTTQSGFQDNDKDQVLFRLGIQLNQFFLSITMAYKYGVPLTVHNSRGTLSMQTNARLAHLPTRRSVARAYGKARGVTPSAVALSRGRNADPRSTLVEVGRRAVG